MIQFWEIAASFAESFLGLWFPAKALANQKISLKKCFNCSSADHSGMVS